jgi:urea carboxylase-associated protein 1
MADNTGAPNELAEAAAIAGTLHDDAQLEAGDYWTKVLPKGAHLRIIDLEGQQGTDFLCYDAARPTENRYNAGNTIKFANNAYPKEGAQLFSDLAQPLMTIVRDTCGQIDTIAGCCSAEANEYRYGVKNTANCRANFIKCLESHGLAARDLVANVNFFSHFPVHADGAAAFEDGSSVAGDYVEMLAETDVIAMISNCPQENNPCAGFAPTPIRVIAWTP